MEKIKDVLKNVLGDLKKKSRAEDLQRAQKVWERVAGPEALRHTKIVYLTKERIRVNVDTSTWLFELNLRKARIAKALKKTLKVEDVRFRLGDIGDSG